MRMHTVFTRMGVCTIELLVLSLFASGSTEAMTFPSKDWQQATPASQNIDADKLNEAVQYLAANSGPDGVKELVIVRNGYLVWQGSDIDKVHGVWSMTKSFTSTILGLLIDDGKVTLDTPAKEFDPVMGRDYPKVTLRHFTTMTSGYYALGDEPQGSYRHGPSATPFTPAAMPLFEAGVKYAYWDSAMNQFGNCLTQAAGESMKELFKRRIADPIRISADKWNWGDFGAINGVVVNGGAGNHNKHIFICAREAARLGHLFLNRGKWEDKQLIGAAWVENATRPQVPASIELGHLSSADGRGVYGFNWWANGIKADGKRKWPDAPVGTYSASGFNNNDMFIVPEWNMVIVRLGLDESAFEITDKLYNTFLRKIGQALIERPVVEPQRTTSQMPADFPPP